MRRPKGLSGVLLSHLAADIFVLVLGMLVPIHFLIAFIKINRTDLSFEHSLLDFSVSHSLSVGGSSLSESSHCAQIKGRARVLRPFPATRISVLAWGMFVPTCSLIGLIKWRRQVFRSKTATKKVNLSQSMRSKRKPINSIDQSFPSKQTGRDTNPTGKKLRQGDQVVTPFSMRLFGILHRFFLFIILIKMKWTDLSFKNCKKLRQGNQVVTPLSWRFLNRFRWVRIVIFVSLLLLSYPTFSSSICTSPPCISHGRWEESTCFPLNVNTKSHSNRIKSTIHDTQLRGVFHGNIISASSDSYFAEYGHPRRSGV